MTYVIIPASPSGLLDESIQTLPQVLEQESYVNYMVGKWHLGHALDKLTPTNKGFHHFTGLIVIVIVTIIIIIIIMIMIVIIIIVIIIIIIGLYTWDIDSYTKRAFLFPRILGGRKYLDWLKVSKNQPAYYYTDSDHATIAITKASTDYIDEHMKYNSSQPFFLYVSYTAGTSNYSN